MPGLAARGLTLTGAAAGVIPNITSFSGPGIGLDVEDVTSHDSTGGWEEVVPTILRSGEVTFEINYTPAAHHYAAHGLAFNLVTRLIDTWTIGGPMGAWSFQGYVTKFEPSAPFDGKMTASVSIKVTGAVTVP
jgi:predicted secreted protein